MIHDFKLIKVNDLIQTGLVEGILYMLILHYCFVGSVWLNGPWRQLFSLYRGVSQRMDGWMDGCMHA